MRWRSLPTHSSLAWLQPSQAAAYSCNSIKLYNTYFIFVFVKIKDKYYYANKNKEYFIQD